MSKKNVLLIATVYIIFFITTLIVSEICNYSWCRIHDDDFLGIILLVFLPLIPVFFLTLITYRMRDEVFQTWWKFARWFVPAIMLVTLFCNSQSRGGGMSATIGGAFDMFFIGIFYAIFIITSLVKIILVHNKTK